LLPDLLKAATSALVALASVAACARTAPPSGSQPTPLAEVRALLGDDAWEVDAACASLLSFWSADADMPDRSARLSLARDLRDRAARAAARGLEQTLPQVRTSASAFGTGVWARYDDAMQASVYYAAGLPHIPELARDLSFCEGVAAA